MFVVVNEFGDGAEQVFLSKVKLRRRLLRLLDAVVFNCCSSITATKHMKGWILLRAPCWPAFLTAGEVSSPSVKRLSIDGDGVGFRIAGVSNDEGTLLVL